MSAPSSRASTPRSSSTRTQVPRKRKERQQSLSTSSSSTPGHPAIELPSAEGPPPANFLRNQQALLGLAGFVGGVNPAQLPASRRATGSSVEDPIIVEEAPISGTYAQPPSLAPDRRPQLTTVNHGQLPVPSSRDILATLARQKNVFPVVESLLRLLVRGGAQAAAPPPQPVRTGWERTPVPQAPPLKRRKLSSVPAGAADWDVPYPFPAGQGPAEYRTSWEQERARRLLADLLGLVQSAAQKASLQVHQQEQERTIRREWESTQSANVHRYYRPATLLYGVEFGKAASSPPMPELGSSSGSRSHTPALGVSVAPPSPELIANDLPSTDIAFSQQASFDQLVASLATIPDPSKHTAATSDSTNPSASSSSSLFSEDDSSHFFDQWLSLLDAYPPGDPDAPSSNSSQGSDKFAAASAPSYVPDHPHSYIYPSQYSSAHSIPDCLIDPTLLAPNAFCSSTVQSFSNVPSTSLPVPNQHQNETVRDLPATPALIGSPFASTSSLLDPATPDVAWAFAEPAVAGAGADVEQQGAGVELVEGGEGCGPACVEPSARASADVGLRARCGEDDAPPRSPPVPSACRQTADAPGSVLPPRAALGSRGDAAPARTQARRLDVDEPSASGSATPALALEEGGKAPTAKEARARLLARARTLRKMLVAAAERAKVELWETTLEQGVLVGLVKEARAGP